MGKLFTFHTFVPAATNYLIEVYRNREGNAIDCEKGMIHITFQST